MDISPQLSARKLRISPLACDSAPYSRSDPFNLEQVDGGYPDVTTVPAAETLDEVDLFVRLTKARIEHGGTRAYFDPGSDYIAIPDKARFVGSPTSTATECYYSTLLHELVHNAVTRTMPHGVGQDLVSQPFAMRHFGIIRALRGT